MPQLDTNDPSFMPHTTTNQWLWHWIMTQHYNESMHHLQTTPYIPTFRRGGTSTTIDYMFLHPLLASFVHSSAVDFIHREWTDHALLSVNFKFDSPEHGSGIWRANPNLAKNAYFVEQLTSALDEFHQHLSQQSDPPPVQSTWDAIKKLTAKLARRIGRRRAHWRQQQLKRLQRSRNRMLRKYKETRILNERLPIIEQQIGMLQQEIVDTLAVRAGLRWRGEGELSAGLFKRIIQRKTQQRTIPAIQHPVTGIPCEEPHQQRQGIQHFYQELYTPAPSNTHDTEFFTKQIPQQHQIDPSKHEAICAPFTLADIQAGGLRSPRSSSPGPDGLPYELLTILLQHPATGQLAVKIYNDALQHSIFPASWLQTCMTLLPKKGDLTLLQNWKPISLINADAKIFTRLLNARLMTHMNKCISTNQMGFMPRRFIGEQGMIVHCLQELASNTKSDEIALLLDQQKAYDRVHFDYLQQCMKAFNIPDSIISSVTSLFSSTKIQVNVNGYLTDPFQQSRGLRQGDPLSPLLFNIAFDPLLRSIDQCPDIQGFDLSKITNRSGSTNTTEPDPNSTPSDTAGPTNHPATSTDIPPPIKVIAYADDTLVTLSKPEDFHQLQEILAKYMNASNAQLNYDKTQVLSLSGAPHPHWQSFLQEHGIHHWHDRTSPDPLIYLGYPIVSHPSQRAAHAQKVIANLKKLCLFHSMKPLTYRAKVTIVNSLIYSKLWHMICLFSFSQQELHQIQQIAAAFINNNVILNRFSFDHLTQPRSLGGLQLLDPLLQANALQWRWLHYLLHPSQPNPTHMPSIPILRFTLHVVLATTDFPTYHWSLLFPSCRPVIPRVYGIVVNLLRAADAINNDLQHSSVDIPTCLRLPLPALLCTQLPSTHRAHSTFEPPDTVLKHNPTARQLRGSDIFTYNTNSLHLEHFTPTQPRPHLPTSNLVIQLIQSNQLHLQPFVLFNMLTTVPRTTLPPFTSDLTSITPLTSLLLSKLSSAFDTNLFTYSISPPTTSGFKSLPTHQPPSTNYSPLTASKWKQFWRLRIPLTARNTWYRFLHKKVATKQLLHQRQPEEHTPFCGIYRPRGRYRRHANPPAENLDHFIFHCPKKYRVWKTAIATYLDPHITFSILDFFDLLHLRSAINRTPTAPCPQLSPYQVFACILQAIWISHYRFVFDAVPFDTQNVLTLVNKTIHNLDTEENLHSST